MTKARTLADMISDGVIGTTELADDVITPVKLDETGNYTIAQLDVNGTITSDGLTVDGNITLDEASAAAHGEATKLLTASGNGYYQDLRVSANEYDFRYGPSAWNASYSALQIGSTGNVVFNEAGLNADFRVESDSQSHALFVDASNNTVGVGTSSVSSVVAANFHGKGILFRNNVNGDNTNWTRLHNTASSDRSNLLIQPSTGSVEITQGGGITVANTAGYDTIFNTNGVDADFRVESSNNANMLFVDGEKDLLSVGGAGNNQDFAGSLQVIGNTVESSNAQTAYSAKFMSSFSGLSDGGGFTTMIGLSCEPSHFSKGAIGWTRTASYDQGRIGFFNRGISNDTNAQKSDEMMRISASEVIVNPLGSATKDFRVESDSNAHMLFVDASTDNVGIGTNAPANFSGYVGLTTYGASLGSFLQMTGASCTSRFVADSSSNSVQIKSVTQHPLVFYTNDAESARFQRTANINGMFMLGTTSSNLYGTSNDTGVTIQGSSQRQNGNGAAIQIACKEDEGWANIYLNRWHDSAQDTRYVQFSHGSGASLGSINRSGSSAVVYNTSSDYRLKENVVTLSNGIDRVKQLQPIRFSWIVDDEDSANVDGFLAHQAQTVVPEAVTGEKDATKTVEGEVVPDYQGIDHSKMVPLLTAALQEAIAKIETLEARIVALENA